MEQFQLNSLWLYDIYQMSFHIIKLMFYLLKLCFIKRVHKDGALHLGRQYLIR